MFPGEDNVVMVKVIQLMAVLCGLNTGKCHVRKNCKPLFRLHHDTRHNNLTTTNTTINLLVKLIRLVDIFVASEVCLSLTKNYAKR